MKDSKEPKKDPKQNQPKDNTKGEGYDDPSKNGGTSDDGGFNTVCISSLVFAFVGIGVLLSLATWSYVTTMSNADDNGSGASHKSDHVKQQPHKPNSTTLTTTSKHNGITDFTNKISDASLTQTDNISKNGTLMSTANSVTGENNITSRRHDVSFPVMEPVTDDLNLEMSFDSSDKGQLDSVGSLGRRIESISPSEVYLMKERLKSHRHTFNALKKRVKEASEMTREKINLQVDSL